MAGREVTRELLDRRIAEAIIDLRNALDKTEIITEYLTTVPSNAPGGDPLTLPAVPTDPMDPNSTQGIFGYTADEAYLIRFVFESLGTLNSQVQPIRDAARRLTGLD